VLVPKASPTFSALGTLVANPCIDEERSYICPANSLDTDKLKALWQQLGLNAETYFADATYEQDDITAKYQMNLRYAGQNWALTFDLHTQQGLRDLSFVNAELGNKAIAAFNTLHMQEYGHVREGEMPEVTGVRLATSVTTASPCVIKGFTAPSVVAKARHTRRANLGQGYADTNIHRGAELKLGDQVIGPAIIEETFTTIVVYPGWQARVDDAGDYELTRM
jgi:N-methylhydantoinase A